jgi:hypothetical protein
MEMNCCEMKCAETEDGIKIEIKGKAFKEFFEACKKGNFSCCEFGV